MLVESPGFSQLHVDVARFATDDFNLFHDPHKWHRLAGNPYGGPIVLGFQMETWVAEAVAAYRHTHDDPALLARLRFSHYQIHFAAALKPGQRFNLTIKPSHWDEGQKGLSNRLLLRSDQGIVLMGHHRLTQEPLVLAEKMEQLPELCALPDRSEVMGYFLKRKFMMTANAKNFLLGCLVDPIQYFDELAARTAFPEIFPVSYISCALLERAWREGHDFERAPMVYTYHEISIDRKVGAEIKSNDPLHLLVAPENSSEGRKRFRCLGLIRNDLLFQARIELMPLAEIVRAMGRSKTA
ncbi:MAG: hypothetical protein N3A55_03475 [Methylohalobius sp.]|nr:hypothetical protein [Methylohalobius sp.]